MPKELRGHWSSFFGTFLQATSAVLMAESDFVKRELAKDIFMYTQRTDVEKEMEGYAGVKETTIEYAVECSSFRELDFTLKWGDGSQNLAWPDDLKASSVTVKCLPYERKPLVKLVQQGS
jgi:hypothetical protein